MVHGPGQNECMGECGQKAINYHLSQGPTCFPALCGDHPSPFMP